MKTRTSVRLETYIDLTADEEFDLDLGLNGDCIVRVKQIRATTNLAGRVTSTDNVYVSGLRYKKDGSLGKSPASDLLLWGNEQTTLPASILQSIREAVQRATADDRESLGTEPRTRSSDGSLIVSSEVASVLFALAHGLETETETVLEQIRSRRGDYLTSVESLGGEFAAQMRVLGHSMWGAGTASL